MLGRGRDDVAAAPQMRESLHGEVVRFGGARGEDDLVRLDVDRGGDARPGVGHGLEGGFAEAVPVARGVAEHLEEVRRHRVEDAAVDGRRRMTIEIDRELHHGRQLC